MSTAKTVELEKEVAHHLRVLRKRFEWGDIDKDNVSDVDETHFVLNMDNGRTFRFTSDEHMRYADVTSGGESLTMIVRRSRGPTHANRATLFDMRK